MLFQTKVIQKNCLIMKVSTKQNRACTILVVVVLWVCFQAFVTHRYKKHSHQSDSRLFAQHFDVVPLGRTNKHNKDIKYWFDWLQTGEGDLIFSNKKLTLLHFDSQAVSDNPEEEIHACAPGQLLHYDEFVNQVCKEAFYFVVIV